jgi:hypothetical protein
VDHVEQGFQSVSRRRVRGIVLRALSVAVLTVTVGAPSASPMTSSPMTSRAPAGRPDQALVAAQRLYDAWQDGDRAAAAKVATPYAIQHLFGDWSPDGSARPTVCRSQPLGFFGATIGCDAGPKRSEILFAVAVKGSAYVIMNVAGESCTTGRKSGTCYFSIDGG